VIQTLAYLTASVLAIAVVTKIAPTAWAAVTLNVLLIGLLAVLATLNGSTQDLIGVLDAITRLIRGSPSG
jgi:hypothetical protein